MDGAGHAAQLVFERGRFNEILLLACGIQLGFIGSENGGNACRAQFVGILRQRARVLLKIFALPELDAVHKNADHNVFGFLLGALHKGEMPVVQVAHGGHKGDVGNGFAPLAQLGDGVEDVHDGVLTGGFGKRVLATLNGVFRLP